MSLEELSKQLSTDKGTDHSYLEVYDQLFRTSQHRRIRLLEIGIGNGDSLRLWRQYFSNAKITGVDIAPPEEQIAGCKMVKMDQTDLISIEQTWDDETFDIIIDDGSHRLQDQLLTLCWFWPKLKQGGLYVIEDVANSSLTKYFAAFRGLVLDRSSVKGRGDDILIVLSK